MDIYTHTLHGQQSEAVAKLPDLSVTSQEAQRATGTDGVTTAPVLAFCLAQLGGEERTAADGAGQIAEGMQMSEGQEERPFELKNADCDAGTEENGEAGIRTRGKGLPLTTV
jgi:hypothetical protein